MHALKTECQALKVTRSHFNTTHPCSVLWPSRSTRQQLVTVCRYDTRRSANNVAERRANADRRTSSKHLLDEGQFVRANETVVADRARALQTATHGQVSLQMCLFLFNEQPQMLSLNTKHVAARMLSLADVLGLPVADVAELLVRCGAMLDLLPLRLRSASEAFATALNLSKSQALVMLGSDLNLMDTPPLRVRQHLDALAALLQVPLQLLADMTACCPHLLRVEAAAVQIRWTSIQQLLQLPGPALQQLLAREPRLLMPSSHVLAQNHADILQALSISPQTLNRWLFAAPMLLLIPAAQVKKRLTTLQSVLQQEGQGLLRLHESYKAKAAAGAAAADAAGAAAAAEGCGSDAESDSDSGNDSSGSGSVGDSSNSSTSGSSGIGANNLEWACVADDPLQLLAYISKDPRVLLLSPKEIADRLDLLANEMGFGRQLACWLVMSHASYLALEPGLLSNWLEDVRHLTDMPLLQAKRLAACPQVFLTMSPEDVLAALYGLEQALNHPVNGQSLKLAFDSVCQLTSEEPLLLVQHPTVLSAALQQLQPLVQEVPVRQQLLLAAPELLLQGQQLATVMQWAAGLLNLSCSQFAVLLVKQPTLWTVLVPRQVWSCYPQWQHQQQQQQQQQQSPHGAAFQPQLQQPTQPLPLSDAGVKAVETMSALVYCGLQPPQVMQATVVLHPGLLQLTAASALQHVEHLEQLCWRFPSWHKQLRTSLPPDQLGTAILRAKTWHDRLQFLIDAGLAPKIHLSELMQLSRRDFTRAFGYDYTRWQLQNQLQSWQQHQESLTSLFGEALDVKRDNRAGPVAAATVQAASFQEDQDYQVAQPLVVEGGTESASNRAEIDLQQLHDVWQEDADGQLYYEDDIGEAFDAIDSDPLPDPTSGAETLASTQQMPLPAHGQAPRVKTNQPPIQRAEQMIDAIALSGLDLYQTWQGCVVQPIQRAPTFDT